MKNKNITIKIKLSTLKKICDFYQIPIVVFFDKNFNKKGKADKILDEKIKKLNQIKEKIIELLEKI